MEPARVANVIHYGYDGSRRSTKVGFNRWSRSCFVPLTMTHLFRELTRFVPDQDTITEVLIVLGIVIMIFFFSKTDNLQTITRQVSPYSSEASPTISQK